MRKKNLITGLLCLTMSLNSLIPTLASPYENTNISKNSQVISKNYEVYSDDGSLEAVITFNDEYTYATINDIINNRVDILTKDNNGNVYINGQQVATGQSNIAESPTPLAIDYTYSGTSELNLNAEMTKAQILASITSLVPFWPTATASNAAKYCYEAAQKYGGTMTLYCQLWVNYDYKKFKSHNWIYSDNLAMTIKTWDFNGSMR